MINKNLKIKNWTDIEPFFLKLQNHDVQHALDLETLIQNYSDVMSVVNENANWAFIHMTCDTADKEKSALYETLAGKVLPLVKKAQENLHQKILNSPFVQNLNQDRYGLLLKKFKNSSDLFSPKNSQIEAELIPLESRFRQITGGLMVNVQNQDLTLPQASLYLTHPDRTLRYEAWSAIHNARLAVKDNLDELFDRMLVLRHQIALNSGFENFRDFKHQEKERFDYTPHDCFEFHNSVKTHVLPIYNSIMKRQQKKLNLISNDLRPWDVDGTPENLKPLKPFQTAEELLQKGLTVFETLDLTLAQNIHKMKAHQLFDLESRKGKAPGGYNCYLDITEMPFIYMNAAGSQREVVTLMHECGHATHNFISNHDPLCFYRDFPIEVAETASMSMELLTMPLWYHYYENNNDHKRAQIKQWESIVSSLVWIAVVDAFQHWIYLNPTHTAKERNEKFSELFKEFHPQEVNWDGHLTEQQNIWQKQLHIFEVPFYYIEYGIAQIGALQVYKNYKHDPKTALEKYKYGLSLGGTKPLPQLWEAMGIRFDFSSQNIKELMQFVSQELEMLYSSS